MVGDVQTHTGSLSLSLYVFHYIKQWNESRWIIIREKEKTLFLCVTKRRLPNMSNMTPDLFFFFLKLQTFHLNKFISFCIFLPLGCYRVKFFFYYFVVLGECLSLVTTKIFFFSFYFILILLCFVFFFLVFITAQVCYRNPVPISFKGGNKKSCGIVFFWEGNQSCAFACFVFFIVWISNEFSWAFIKIQFYVRISLRLLWDV